MSQDHLQSVFPDWRKAELHAQAVTPGRPMNQLESKRICECCRNIIDREEVDVRTHIKELSFLGFGVPLFYLFLQYCIVLNLLLVVTDGLIDIDRGVTFNLHKCSQLQNSKANQNHFMGLELRGNLHEMKQTPKNIHDYQNVCNNPFVFVSNIERTVGRAEIITQVCSYIILFIFLMYMKISFQDTGSYYNEISIDLQDYAVIFKGLTKDVLGKKTIFRQLLYDFQDKDQKQKPAYDIFVAPDNIELLELLQENQKYNSEYLQQKADQKVQASLTLNKYMETKAKINKYIAQSIYDIKDDKVQSDNVIILFNYEEDRAEFLQPENIQWIKNKLSKNFNQKCIKELIIEQASGPKEIIWQNLHILGSRWGRIAVGWGLSLIFLFLTLVVFYLLSMWKANKLVEAIEADQHDKNQQTSKHLVHATWISWASFFGIILFNKFIMSIVLHYFTHLERHDNRATQEFSFAFKYALGMFFTTACMTLVVEAYHHGNYFKHKFGVIQEQSLMFIFSAVLIPVIWLVNPYQLVHLIKRKKYFQTQKVTQKQANHLMANFEYSIGKRYAEVIEMMWFTFLYVDLIPAGTILILFGLCVYYWVDKFNLMRRSSFTHKISSTLSEKVSRLIDLTIFWRSMGCVIFDYHLKGSVSTHNWILLGVSVVYCILPLTQILQHFLGQKFKVNDQKLSDVWDQNFIYDNYRSMNPLYVQLMKHPDFNEEKEMKKEVGLGRSIGIIQ